MNGEARVNDVCSRVGPQPKFTNACPLAEASRPGDHPPEGSCILMTDRQCRRLRRGACCSSIGEEMGVLGLVPARTMRATAAECLLPVTSQAIRRHRRDRGVGAGVAPDFMTKRNSELADIRDERRRRRASRVWR
jgi:hypothetical protein